MALIKDTAELKAHVGTIQKNINFNTLLPNVEQAEIRYIIPYIGEAFYENLNTKHAASSGSTEEIELINRLGRAIAFYTLLDSMPMLNISIGELGIHQSSSNDGTSNPASGWAYWNALLEMSKKADYFFEHALAYLDANASALIFTIYNSSTEKEAQRKLIINNASGYAAHLGIEESRRTFLKVRPYIATVEKRIIKSKIGDEMYAELKAEILANSISAANSTLLEELTIAIANLATFEALPFLSIAINDSGIHVVNENENVRQKTQADKTEKSMMMERLLTNGNEAMSAAIRILYKTPADYPTFTASDTYEPDEIPKPYERPSPSGKKSFFA